jgi:hypothetical protein
MTHIYSHSGTVTLGSKTLRPFDRTISGGDSRLTDAGLVTPYPALYTQLASYCTPSDLVYYNDETDPTNIDFPHRYFHPPASNGIIEMLKVPKVIIRMPTMAVPGEAMSVTWYFWADWRHLSVLGNPVPDDSTQAILDLATDVVRTWEPIPDEPWEFPVLASLPLNLGDMAGPSRVNALTKRI